MAWCMSTLHILEIQILILISISARKTDLIMRVALLCEEVVMSSSVLVTRFYFNIDCIVLLQSFAEMDPTTAALEREHEAVSSS